MIIVCSGPDTYRAREKARELMDAFRKKHDAEGLSTEILDSVDLKDVLSRLGSASLFSKKKMIRVDGVLGDMKISDVRTLAAKLQVDGDNTILLTVESEDLNAKTLETLKLAPLFHYPFPTQTGPAFKKWAILEAEKRNVSVKTAEQLAEAYDGDSWRVVTELQKHAANPDLAVSDQNSQDQNTVFELSDAFFTEKRHWRTRLMNSEEDGYISVFLSQGRALLRVRDGADQGLHPFVVKKARALQAENVADRMMRLIMTFYTSRSGLATGRETDILLK